MNKELINIIDCNDAVRNGAAFTFDYDIYSVIGRAPISVFLNVPVTQAGGTGINNTYASILVTPGTTSGSQWNFAGIGASSTATSQVKGYVVRSTRTVTFQVPAT